MIESIQTEYGCTIKICCASCRYCLIQDMVNRKCMITEKYTLPSSKCMAWQVKPKHMNAGKGGGSITPKRILLERYEKKMLEIQKMKDVLSTKKRKEEAVICKGSNEEAEG